MSHRKPKLEVSQAVELPNSDLLTPPERLPEIAKSLWRKLAPQLIERGRLTEIDVTAFEALTMSYALWRTAANAVIEKGMVITVLRTGTVKVSPAMSAMTSASRTLDGWCNHFMLSPMSRSRAGVVDPHGTEDYPSELDKLLSRRRDKTPSAFDRI